MTLFPADYETIKRIHQFELSDSDESEEATYEDCIATTQRTVHPKTAIDNHKQEMTMTTPGHEIKIATQEKNKFELKPSLPRY